MCMARQTHTISTSNNHKQSADIMYHLYYVGLLFPLSNPSHQRSTNPNTTFSKSRLITKTQTTSCTSQ